MAMAMTGQMAGSTIRANLRQKPAPSISAASSWLWSTLVSAASKSRNMNGVHCQISAIRMAG